jgi:HD-like signal output (HDOD) protein
MAIIIDENEPFDFHSIGASPRKMTVSGREVARQVSSPPGLELIAAKIASANEIPAFARHLRELNEVSRNEKASVHGLAAVILKNQGLTARLIRTVNSALFKRGDREILSVTQAVSLLGWEKVQDLASGLLLYEHFANKPKGTKELMFLSLLTAMNARELSKTTEYPRPEEAYLAGMFSGMGELLVSCYLQPLYLKVEAMKSKGSSEKAACAAVLGCTYDDVGRDTVRRYNLPARVTAGMTDPLKLSSLAPSEDSQLAVISSSAHALTRAAHYMEADEGRALVEQVISRHGCLLGVGTNEVREIIQMTAESSRDAALAAGVRLRNSLEDTSESETSIADLKAAGPPSDDILPASADSKLLTTLVGDFVRAIDQRQIADNKEAVLRALECIYLGGRFSRVLLCTVDNATGRLRGRLGVGAEADELVKQFNFSLSSWGALPAAILGKKPIFIESSNESNAVNRELLDVSKAASFGILPLVVGDRSIGCLYFDRTNSTLGLSAQDKSLITTVAQRLQAVLV